MDTPEEELTVLAHQLADHLGGEHEALCLHLIRLLAEGQPVEVRRLSAVSGVPTHDLHVALCAIADAEYDSAGNVIGFGLSLLPTAHHFIVNERTFYTWCALDTFMYTSLLEQPTQVRSVCPTTHIPIRIAMTPDGIDQVDPPSAVISLVVPEGSVTGCRRSAFCNHGHFFSSIQAAAYWQGRQDNALVLPVATAHTLGRRIMGERIANARSKAINSQAQPLDKKVLR